MPDRLEELVADFLRRYELFAGAGGVLLAVSGGADSIALLHVLVVLKAQGWLEADLVCAHINHQLRGPASDADERFVIEQADRLGVPVIARTVDVRSYAERHGLSLETAARQLRLASLADIANRRGCTWIATGHQKNDNAETVLHRLLRGTGFRGLAGIRPQRRLGSLRLASPLLCVTRQEILLYLQRRGLAWREDRTNADITYTRNYIRHKLLPLLQQEAQGCLIDELSDLALAAEKLDHRIERQAQDAWARFVEPAAGRIAIDAAGLAALPEPVAVELIRKALVSLGLGERDLTESHYLSTLQLAGENMSGKTTALPHGFLARREGHHLVLSGTEAVRRVGLVPPAFHPEPLAVPGTIRLAGREIEASVLPRTDVDVAQIEGDKSPFVEYLDFDRIERPVIVRTRQPGDKFQPLGLPQAKKLGKFLTTAKVPHDLREQILVFADHAGIIWVCPVRISERAKITETTQRILRLTVRRV